MKRARAEKLRNSILIHLLSPYLLFTSIMNHADPLSNLISAQFPLHTPHHHLHERVRFSCEL
jgi:hypothetical protein